MRSRSIDKNRFEMALLEWIEENVRHGVDFHGVDKKTGAWVRTGKRPYNKDDFASNTLNSGDITLDGTMIRPEALEGLIRLLLENRELWVDENVQPDKPDDFIYAMY